MSLSPRLGTISIILSQGFSSVEPWDIGEWVKEKSEKALERDIEQ
jgi:hypothetical protein